MAFSNYCFYCRSGEIAYWAELKLVFEHFEIKMPPIVPSLNITLLDRSVETDMAELNLNLARRIERWDDERKETNFLNQLRIKKWSHYFQLERPITKAVPSIEAKTNRIDRGLVTFVKEK